MSRIVLIGCGKAKRAEACEAADLYTGSLFAARRRYAEASGCPWYIVSAERGLLAPSDWVEPYDTRITDLAFVDQVALRLSVAMALLDGMSDTISARELLAVCAELHMGADYAEGLRDVLLAAGMSASWPVQHMGIGEQLGFYKRESERTVPRAA